ncbi:MAG: ParB/Srx family N-terminal domain-containing protein [Roseburia sp.]|nr:ParB/Srx family N-terminal domain-containing protein [Roseburia sp.]
MKIVKKSLTDLHAPARNIRKHTDKQISEYVRSLQMFGQIKPVVVDEAGEIIAGNGLYQALLQMGATECDCYVLSGLSEKQKKKLMLADNRVYELGVTDMDAFESIIKDLEGDIDVPGWDEDLLAMMNAAAAEVDDMVSGYGNFDQENVDRLAERSAPPTGSTPAPAPAAPQGPDAADAPTEKPDVQKVIVCPKCGERICL